MTKRKEIITIHIVDFTKDKDEPAYDVEIYIDGEFKMADGGVYSTQIDSKKNAKKKAILNAITELIKLIP